MESDIIVCFYPISDFRISDFYRHNGSTNTRPTTRPRTGRDHTTFQLESSFQLFIGELGTRTPELGTPGTPKKIKKNKEKRPLQKQKNYKDYGRRGPHYVSCSIMTEVGGLTLQ